MRFARNLMQNKAFRILFLQCSTFTRKVPIVKVMSVKDDDCIKLSFKYNNSPTLHIKAPKDEDVQMVLSRIKLMAALQRKREEIRQAVVNKYSNTAQVAVETLDDIIDVCLIQNDFVVNESTPNIDAWSQASVLKIGDVYYEIKYNTPTVLNLSLPDNIVAGCPLRPHFILECASVEDCIFTWHRSITINDAEKLTSNENNSSFVDDEKCWLKVKEGFVYFTSNEDVGCFLKVVCTPKQGNNIGHDVSAVSKTAVQAASDIFPFEERHAFTKAVTGDGSIRCVSYNILANVYVEKRKFPYCSKKARDVYYRKQLLLRELLGYNSDVICLQEVQTRVFEYDLIPVLKEAGFRGLYLRKGGRRYEGLATFYRESKFRILDSHGILLNTIVKEKDIFTDLLTKVTGNLKDMSKLLAQDTAFQVVLLEDVNCSNHKLLLANTHLYSNKDNPEVRLIQAALCVYYLEHIVKVMNWESFGILFCGDFNSLPNSATYEFLTSGNFECCPSWKNNSITFGDITDTTLRHNLYLDSACGTPAYTNYTEEFQGCLDYIFYSENSLEVKDIVPMPSHEKVTANVGLPSEHFPSDHIALVCTLKWKNTQS